MDCLLGMSEATNHGRRGRLHLFKQSLYFREDSQCSFSMTRPPFVKARLHAPDYSGNAPSSFFYASVLESALGYALFIRCKSAIIAACRVGQALGIAGVLSNLDKFIYRGLEALSRPILMWKKVKYSNFPPPPAPPAGLPRQPGRGEEGAGGADVLVRCLLYSLNH